MRLNLDIIEEYLPEEYRVSRYGPECRGCAFSRPRLFESVSELQEGTLYLSRAEMLPQAPPEQAIGMICIGNRIPRPWTAASIPLLVMRDSPGILTVFNQIHSIYDRFDAWDSQLRDALEDDSGCAVKEILRLGSQMLERTITVSDHTLRCIFRTELLPKSDGVTEIRIVDEMDPMPVDYSEKIKDVCRLERVIKTPYLTSLDIHDEKIYCNNLYPAGSFAGCISIREGVRPFRESDYPLMDHFFSCFQRAFLKYLRSYGQVENASLTVLRNLLSHAPVGPEEQALLSLQPGEVWGCFKLQECRGERALLKEYLYATLNGVLPGTVYTFIYHGEVIGMIRLREDAGQSEALLQSFGEILSRMGYTGGVSNLFTDLHLLPYYLQQAGYASECGGGQAGTLHFFRDHVLSYMLDGCTQELPIASLCSRGLHMLMAHDRQKGTEYIKTLDVYLRNEMRITQTAKALYIHRSSLIKRLDRIMCLLQDNLEHPDVRLYYRLCLALLNRKQ